MDYNKLSKVTDSVSKTPSSAEEKKVVIKRILDSRRRKGIKARLADRSSIQDSLKNRKNREYSKFRVTDSYKNLLTKIKDEMSETETTDEAVEAVLEVMKEAPAEQVVAATIEILGETIDALEETALKDEE